MKQAPRAARFAAASVAVAAAFIFHSADSNHFILCLDHCEGPAVPIGSPGAVAVDTKGNVYFSAQNIVFKLDSQGIVTPVAGNGTPGFSGDGGQATEALLNIPYYNYPELVHDPIDFEELVGGLAVDAAGNLYVADAYNNRLRKIDAAGIITTVAGDGSIGVSGDGGLATSARLNWPQGVAVDAAGNIYVGGRLRKIAADGVISRIEVGECAFDGHRYSGLCGPVGGFALDAAGNIIAPDVFCKIVKVGADGSVITVAGDERPDPIGFAFTCGNNGDNAPAVGTALAWPWGVAVDAVGNLYIADNHNNCIRRVDGAGLMATVAGTCGIYGFSGDGGTATRAYLKHPHGVAVDGVGNLYIADSDNNRIRKVTPDGIITTVAGSGGAFQHDVPDANIK